MKYQEKKQLIQAKLDLLKAQEEAKKKARNLARIQSNKELERIGTAMTNATKKLALKEFIDESNPQMFEKNMKLYSQEREAARRILGTILHGEDFESDFMETEEEEEKDDEGGW